jgi:hypothetical protein
MRPHVRVYACVYVCVTRRVLVLGSSLNAICEHYLSALTA